MSDVPPLRCVVFGKTGVGKSSFCNLMVDKGKVYNTSQSASSVTRIPQKEAVQFNKKHYEFTDFPGYFDNCLSDEEIEEILGRCVELSLPGPHVFVYVIRLYSRFTAEDRNTLLKLRQTFGSDVFKYMVVIFTCKNMMYHSNENPEQYIVDLKSNLRQGQKQPKETEYLIDILDEGRYACVECYDEGKETRLDAFAVIDKLRTKNGDKYYTNSMYQKAVEKKRQDELEKKRQDELEKKRQRQDELEKKGLRAELKKTKDELKKTKDEWRPSAESVFRTISSGAGAFRQVIGAFNDVKSYLPASPAIYRTSLDVNPAQVLSPPYADTDTLSTEVEQATISNSMANHEANIMATRGAPITNIALQECNSFMASKYIEDAMENDREWRQLRAFVYKQDQQLPPTLQHNLHDTPFFPILQHNFQDTQLSPIYPLNFHDPQLSRIFRHNFRI